MQSYKTPKDFTAWGALGMLTIFFIAGFIITAIMQAVMGYMMVPAGTPFDKLPEALTLAMKDAKNVNMMRMMQVLSTFLMLFVPAILYSKVVNGKNYFWLGFNKYVWVKQVAIGFAAIFLANIMAGPIADLSKSVIANFPKLNATAKSLEDAYNDQVLVLSNLKSWGEYIAAIFIMAFFPALFEEIFFRGALQTLFEKWWRSPFMAILITSIIFSLIHFSIYNFLTRLILGFVLGFMFYKTRNIWVNVIAHFLNNALAVTQLFWLSRQKDKLNIAEIEPKVEWWLGLLALVAIFFLFKLLEKYSAENKTAIALKEKTLLAKEDPFQSLVNQQP
ncbi:MAG TPA: CPBP family intramembrane metalloprotease [Ferruginibacter sp.]|nr:CPBP family intramembrane metalloprotease [Ferruginibacter sp.]